MTQQQKQLHSKRMKTYWANRRASKIQTRPMTLTPTSSTVATVTLANGFKFTVLQEPLMKAIQSN